MNTRIMIADDHSLIREGIKQLLEFDGSMEVVAEASNAEECLSRLENIDFDILLLDINMPDRSGLDVLEEIKKKKL